MLTLFCRLEGGWAALMRCGGASKGRDARVGSARKEEGQGASTE